MKKFRSIVIFSLIALFLAGVFMQAQGALEIRAASSTTVAGWRPMPTADGGTIWVSPSVALTSADIARGEARTLPDGGRAVGVVFTTDGARKMAQLSSSQIDKPIAMLLDGKVVWAPIMRGTVDREAVLTGVTPELLEQVLTRLKQ